MNCIHMLKDTIARLFSVATFIQRGQKVKTYLSSLWNEKQWCTHTTGCYQQLKVINQIYMF